MKKYPYKTACTNCGHVEASMTRGDLDLSGLHCSGCKKVGTINYVKKRSKTTMRRRKWKQDDRVLVNIDGEDYPGGIAELTKTKAKVLFDDGDVYDIKLKDLKPEQGDEEFTPQAFTQYNVRWDKQQVNFKFEAEGGQFFGWWRKTSIVGGGVNYALDLHVEYKDHKYSIETMGYPMKDPREDMESLNADLCAAANKWFYHKCESTFNTLEELRQKAEKPTIVIHRVETLDRIILKLKEYRSTSLRSGGLRVMTFTGDDPDTDPSMRIQMDLTTQALINEGKVPSLDEGATLDRVVDDSSKKTKGRGRPPTVTPDQGNVDELLKKLRASKDKTEQRKIRGVLRKMGHRGGSRTGKKK